MEIFSYFLYAYGGEGRESGMLGRHNDMSCTTAKGQANILAPF